MSNKYVLDASAILALIKIEQGSEIVEEIAPISMMSAVNFSEAVSEMNTKLGMDIVEAQNAVCDLVSQIIPFDIEQAVLAGSLKKNTKSLGLSLGDRACIALGIIYNARIYSADRIWAKIEEPNCKIVIIR